MPKETLLMVGGGTATYTHLYTVELRELENIGTIIIAGDNLGYWGYASHTLAQTKAIMALPHEKSAKFINADKANKILKIVPHDPKTAYITSEQYQKMLIELRSHALGRMKSLGIKVISLKKELVTKIRPHKKQGIYIVYFSGNLPPIVANKVILATGLGPGRKIAEQIVTDLDCKSKQERIIGYTDMLLKDNKAAEKCKNKKVVVYGGGATAAWIIERLKEVTNISNIIWIASSGFENAYKAGPRVEDIVAETSKTQYTCRIKKIMLTPEDRRASGKMTITLDAKDNRKIKEEIKADYVVNCTGQDPFHAVEGIPHILSKDILEKMQPVYDRNHSMARMSRRNAKKPCLLQWSTPDQRISAIGSTVATFRKYQEPAKNNKYYIDREYPSDSLPRAAQAPVTIAAVVAAISAQNNYMPLEQDAKTSQVTLKSSNINIMNATQLATYFTAKFPKSSAKDVNYAVDEFIRLREKVEFGVNHADVMKFFKDHFGCQPQESQINKDIESKHTVIDDLCSMNRRGNQGLGRRGRNG